ncbi:hypothetical protein [Paenibacillus xylaniclasticus]|uniref:hypothetical protein n=1 Tax=Paenibacillus xylaniclasticus TaxID=588083 RepID=UPI000FDB2709|nr:MULTISPECIES: hypothetical protein [Paenibacillus]GFN30484.1 hypothetical protein PCURB6_07440 [Paenibacillus curdlanolyticus]
MKKFGIACLVILLVVVNAGLVYFVYTKVNEIRSNNDRQTASQVSTKAMDQTDSEPQSSAPIPGSLGISVEQFRKQFNALVQKNNNETLQIHELNVHQGELQDTASYVFSGSIGLLLTVNQADQTVRKISLFYSNGDVKSMIDYLLAMGIVVEITNPNLPVERRSEVLQDFGFIGDSTELDFESDIHKYSIKNDVVYQFMNGAGADGSMLLFNASSTTDEANQEIIKNVSSTEMIEDAPSEKPVITDESDSKNRTFIENMELLSRFHYSLLDEEGSTYELFVMPVTESQITVSKDDTFAGADEGDILYTGKYDLTLTADGGDTTVDRIPFSTGAEQAQFNMNRQMNYVVSDVDGSSPDVLVLSQYATSSLEEVHLYIVADGRIEPLTIRLRQGGVTSQLLLSSRMVSLGAGQYETRSYNNADGLTYVSIYSLDVETLQLVEESSYTISGVQLEG